MVARGVKVAAREINVAKHELHALEKKINSKK